MYNKEVPNPMSMDFRAVEKASTIFRGMKFEVLWAESTTIENPFLHMKHFLQRIQNQTYVGSKTFHYWPSDKLNAEFGIIGATGKSHLHGWEKVESIEREISIDTYYPYKFQYILSK